MKRCVIIGGAPIRNYSVLRNYLKPDDFFIFCDSGLKHREGLCAEPDLIIGDFDSWDGPMLPAETVKLPREKDDTDTMAAVREADRRGFEEFLLLGVFGERMDHTLANVYILTWLDGHGKKAYASDDFSEFEIVSREIAYINDSFPYFSVVNIAGTAKGITIRNAKYTLENAEIPYTWQYGVSNEPLPGKTASVSVADGLLLLIKDRRS